MLVFSKLGFTKIKDLKAGSVFLVKNKKGELFALKQNPAAERIVKFSKQVHQDGGALADIVPQFWAKDGWFWLEFLPWPLAGDTVKTHGLSQEALNLINPEKLARAESQLQKMTFKEEGMETRSADFYLGNIIETKEALDQEFGRGFFDKVLNFLLAQKEIIDKYSLFLANGDPHPQNIMYKEQNFVLIDWDLLHFNNPAWDLTDFYLWGWRRSNWGDRLLKEYKKSISMPISDFETIFGFDLVYLASQLVKHALLIKAPVEFMEAQKKILLEKIK